MLAILEFIFSSFWTFIGTLILIVTIGASCELASGILTIVSVKRLGK